MKYRLVSSLCINLDRRPDRWLEVSREFRRVEFPVRRWKARDGRELPEDVVARWTGRPANDTVVRGAMACALSHRDAWHFTGQFLGEPDAMAAVFEDDVWFADVDYIEYSREVWWSCLYAYLEMLPDDWAFLSLGSRQDTGGNGEQIAPGLWRARTFTLAHAYLLRGPDVVRELLAATRAYEPADYLWDGFHEKGLSYTVWPPLAVQRIGHSDISQRRIERHVKHPEWKDTS